MFLSFAPVLAWNLVETSVPSAASSASWEHSVPRLPPGMGQSGGPLCLLQV